MRIGRRSWPQYNWGVTKQSRGNRDRSEKTPEDQVQAKKVADPNEWYQGGGSHFNQGPRTGMPNDRYQAGFGPDHSFHSSANSFGFRPIKNLFPAYGSLPGSSNFQQSWNSGFSGGHSFGTFSPRSVDGVGNNPFYPKAGSAHTEFSRIAPQDPSRAPGVNGLPSPRDISNVVVSSDGKNKPDPDGSSDLLWQWGQFVDHDMDIAAAPNTRAGEKGEDASIDVPRGDPQFDPRGTGANKIDFTRSKGTLDENGQRQQTNEITSFLDGSQVYGSDQETADSLRTHRGGELKTSEGNNLPVDPETGNFVAGDERVNEQPGLTSMHTVFMREHNRLAKQYASENPNWSDEQVYQAAKAKNTAYMQSVTYNEYLPKLLGKDAVSPYQGYNPNVDPAISNEFATASYRFGHSMVSGDFKRLGPDGKAAPGGDLKLSEAFNNPDVIKNGGIDPIIRGQASTMAQKLDNEIVDDLRNQLFGPPGSANGGLDLASLNIQRGRDHELSSYNDTREALGKRRIESWDDPIFRDGVGEKMSKVYDSPDDIDLWVGGLAEKNTGDSKMGETFTDINARQFENLRDGDRYYYENTYSGAELEEIQNTSLSDIIRRNTGVDYIQDDAFTAAAAS